MSIRKSFVTAVLILMVLFLLAACHLANNSPSASSSEAFSPPAGGFMLYVGPTDGFTLYVDGSGTLLAADGTADIRGLLPSLELEGLPYEEGLITMLQALADKQWLPGGNRILLSYVAVDRGVADLLCQRGASLVSKFLAETGFPGIHVDAVGLEFLPDTMPEDYALYETYISADYAAIRAKAEYYDQLVRDTEDFCDYPENPVPTFPFLTEFWHEGLWVQVFYRNPDTPDYITLSSTNIRVSIVPVLGTDTYRVHIAGMDGDHCSIYYSDGHIDSAFGIDLLYSRVYGQVYDWRVYLPDADPQDYETLKSLMEKYEGLAVEYVEDSAILRISREQDVLIIRYIVSEDRFEVSEQADSTP